VCNVLRRKRSRQEGGTNPKAETKTKKEAKKEPVASQDSYGKAQEQNFATEQYWQLVIGVQHDSCRYTGP